MGGFHTIPILIWPRMVAPTFAVADAPTDGSKYGSRLAREAGFNVINGRICILLLLAVGERWPSISCGIIYPESGR